MSLLGRPLRFRESVIATADSTGSATFTFPRVANQQAWEGTINVPGAPSSALFIATLETAPVGSWPGTSTWGPITAFPSEQLVITATGLVPAGVYTAVWIGLSLSPTAASLSYPAPLGALPTGGASGSPVVGFVQSGSFDTNGTMSPTVVGNIICAVIANTAIGDTPGAPTGGGVTTWNLVTTGTNGVNKCAVSWGVVTAIGSHSAGAGTGLSCVWAEFLPAVGSSWALDVDGTAASLTGPSLTPSNAAELAWYGWNNSGVLTGGSGAGFVFLTPLGGEGIAAAYNVKVGGAVAPVATGSSNTPISAGMLLAT